MRVLQLHNTQTARGGADLQHEREREGLEARGHVVDTLLIDNREIDQIGKPRAAVRAVWNQDAVRRLRTAIEQFKPDVVHVHTPFPLMSPAVFVAAHRAGLPVVSTVQAWRYNCIKATMLRDDRVCEDCVGRVVKYPGVVHRCYHESLAGSLALTASLATHRGLGTFRNCVDRWLALTPFMRERLIAEGIAPEKIVVKPNTAPDPGLGDTERDGSVLFVGRFVPEKGIDTLLGAWAAFEGERRLVIAGDGPLRPTVEAAAAADPRIDYRGWLDSAGVTALLASAEVLVLPSEWYEGLPVLLAEAFSTSTPVISSDVGNFTDYVEPGRNGMRFRSGDPADLVRALTDYFAASDHARLRAGARTTFEQTFAAEPVLDLLERVYTDLVDPGSAR